MKKLFLLLLLLTATANAQIVSIPDANFKAKLLTSSPDNLVAWGQGGYMKIDANNDGQIQLSEAQVIDSLNVDGAAIANLTGLIAFANLKKLDCSSNALTALDASPFVSLQSLFCTNNAITSLNINGLINLDILYCAYNPLNSLDITSLINLKTLLCNNNQLNNLDLTNSSQLEGLYCFENNISSLNLTSLSSLKNLICSNNPLNSIALNGLSSLESLDVGFNLLSSLDLSSVANLRSLYCANNQITSLDFSGLLNLQQVQCSYNQISSLDFSGNPAFYSLYCASNNLTYINLKNGPTSPNIDSDWDNNPNLTYVCIDEDELPIIQQILDWNGITIANVNSFCSFSPGGNYNTITGTMRFDLDNNGCNVNDLTQPYLKLKINDGVADHAVFINHAGLYKYFTHTGNFTLIPEMENPTFFNFIPSPAIVNFTNNNNNIATQDFCITANGINPDVAIIQYAILRAVPGLDARYQLYFQNKGNQPVSGTINLTFDDARTDFISSTPTANQVGNSLTWNYTTLLPFESRSIDLTFNINSPVETPPVNVGDILDFTATINPVVSDILPTDNVFNFHQIVVNACDPNDKTCLEGDTVTPNNIGKYLHYNINFENVGTANATNIVIEDIIDPTKFDINSVQLLFASHPVEAKVDGNKISFIFQGINLPPSSISPIGGHGNVLFKIKTLNTLVVGDQVANTANIFFDYNAPIDTNEARTTFANLNNAGFIKDNSVKVFPNPAKDIIRISANTNIHSIQLFDIQGRILQSIIETKNATTINLSANQNGVYFLRIATSQGTNIEKIIKASE